MKHATHLPTLEANATETETWKATYFLETATGVRRELELLARFAPGTPAAEIDDECSEMLDVLLYEQGLGYDNYEVVDRHLVCE